MRVFVVEDEKIAQANLVKTLKSNFMDVEIVGTSSSVKETLEKFSDPDFKVDVIFMDVELGDGNCFEILKKMKVDANVVMTTAYDKYAVEAFEAGSVDYILKPIELSALHRAVERCRNRRQAYKFEDVIRRFEQLQRGGSCQVEPKKYKERFIVRLGDKFIPIRTEDIAYFYSEDKSNYIVTKRGGHYIIDLSLDMILEEVVPEEFFKISRNCIIAISAIKNIIRLEGGRLKIETDINPPFEMTVSRARVEDFLNWIE